MALVFGLLSSMTGIFSALVAYLTLRAMRVDYRMYTPAESINPSNRLINFCLLRVIFCVSR
jgi:hypothetical protein